MTKAQFQKMAGDQFLFHDSRFPFGAMFRLGVGSFKFIYPMELAEKNNSDYVVSAVKYCLTMNMHRVRTEDDSVLIGAKFK